MQQVNEKLKEKQKQEEAAKVGKDMEGDLASSQIVEYSMTLAGNDMAHQPEKSKEESNPSANKESTNLQTETVEILSSEEIIEK